ncbi:hypothetical protein AVEN_161926-1 [Araneus ventricosus]|uniref:Uncharacterized protein n=1 Tax=Araneus ventricosus TaxID=182803 RepID=A0A4Y2SQV6_ARAVE|nr:hypothetical protein AVEN_161926-1 [Araneus ventricosus]
MFSWAALGAVVVEQIMKAANYLNIIADQFAPLHGVCLPNWKWNFQEDNSPVTRLNCVEWFEEHTEGIPLMSWPP